MSPANGAETDGASRFRGPALGRAVTHLRVDRSRYVDGEQSLLSRAMFRCGKKESCALRVGLNNSRPV
ncbi:Hypothetical protein SMAX5B_007874 [Scophthalmus maximus]|uniref:Uncharacterized protein n=1 Tax=Scophthalmus maximus TaxID=52904 RepID=A0A2U9C4F1_SCOMX|nr:Hypothetical protein SMAX5B_007874 [Scophthalmus maximus]KAF0042556.1 hypothetical protein F2P81_006088 [Scophthalmus maximus]